MISVDMVVYLALSRTDRAAGVVRFRGGGDDGNVLSTLSSLSDSLLVVEDLVGDTGGEVCIGWSIGELGTGIGSIAIEEEAAWVLSLECKRPHPWRQRSL